MDKLGICFHRQKGENKGKQSSGSKKTIFSFLLWAGLGEVVAPVPGVEDGEAEGEEHPREDIDLLGLVRDKEQLSGWVQGADVSYCDTSVSEPAFYPVRWLDSSLINFSLLKWRSKFKY